MRSIWVKTTAFLLCVLCIGLAAFQLLGLLCDGAVSIYGFENEPEDYLKQQLVFALHQLSVMDSEGDPWFYQNIETKKIHFYMEKGDQVVQNDPALPDTYTSSKFYLEFTNNEVKGLNLSVDEVFSFQQNLNEEWSDCRIIVQYPEKTAEEIMIQWRKEKALVESAIKTALGLLGAALAAFVYLLWVCGRRRQDEEVHLLLIDRMFVEVTAGAFLLAGIGCGAVFSEAGYYFGTMPKMAALLLSVFCAAMAAVLIGLLLSLVRNLKNKTFLQHSFVFRVLRWCWRLVRKLFGSVGNIRKPVETALGQKTGKIAVLGLVGYTLFVCFCMMFISVGSFFFFLVLCAGCVGGCWWVARSLVDFEKVKNGIFAIRGGKIGYKIEGIREGMMGNLASAVNSIGEGMKLSLEKEIRAERMKSELITNVSHDLKTPLTSIINYSDLLCKEELTPPEANDYAKIISQKSQRLKKLTSDLFDISKIQSGNETVSREQLDLKVLAEQALAEVDEAAAEAELEWVISLEEEAMIWGDGKKLSRVFENLFINVIKYSMKHTRVYVTAKKDGTVTVKNISAYPMNFDEEEITERFVRGDASRSTEGSGLGLAIAKSYTQACGGTFSVTVDGDLFKVTMQFEIVKD